MRNHTLSSPNSGHKREAALFQESVVMAVGRRLLQLQFPTVSELHELLKDH